MKLIKASRIVSQISVLEAFFGVWVNGKEFFDYRKEELLVNSIRHITSVRALPDQPV